MFKMFVPLLLVQVCISTADISETFQAPDARLQAAVTNWRKASQARRLTHNAENPAPPRHSSVHLNYVLPSTGEVSAWYNQVKVMASSSVSYFSVNGHQYGYAGIQQVTEQPFKGRVLFSIWDQLCKGDNEAECPADKQVEVTQCGTDVSCVRFGGEGTGAKSQWDWDDWKIGESYGFLTVAKPRENDRVEYTGYFHAPALGQWKVLSSMIVNRGGKAWSLGGLYSFVEQWTHAEVEDVRWARFGPAMFRMEGAPLADWTPVSQARWSHGTVAKEDQTHVHGNVTVSGDKWAMGLGGDLTKGTENSATLTVPAPETCPTPLVDFVALEMSSTLPSASPPTEPPPSVSCGNHRETTCAECPRGNGAGWCNGECTWQNNACVPKEGRRLEVMQCVPTNTPAPTTAPTDAATPAGCNGDASGASAKTPCKPNGATNDQAVCVYGDHCMCKNGYVCADTKKEGECATGTGATVHCEVASASEGLCSYPMWNIPGVGTDTRCDKESGCPKRAKQCEEIMGLQSGETCTVTCANLPRGAADPGSEVWKCVGGTTYTLTTAAIVCPSASTPSPTDAPPNVDKVKITYTLANVDYAKVKSDEKMMSDLISAVQEGVLVGLPTSYTKADIEVSLFAGSVVAVAIVAPQAGSTATELHSSLNTAKQADMEKGVNDNTLKVANIGTALVAGKSLSDVTITSGAPVLPPQKAATTTTRLGQGVVASQAAGCTGSLYTLLIAAFLVKVTQIM